MSHPNQYTDNPKLTAKQENFAQAVVSGMSQADAYREAYDAENMQDNSIHTQGSILAANDKVALRVSELRAPVVEAAQISLKSHLDRLKELSEKAEEVNQFSAAIASEVSRGKASGLYVERTEDLTDPFKKAISGMTAEKAQSMLDAMEQIQVIRAKAAAK